MDLTVKIIPVFFVLILTANYFNFLGFWLILRNLPDVEGRHLRRRTKFYFYTMNVLYLLVVVMSFVPGFQPRCTDAKTYPYVMSWASFLFIINYLFHCVVNCNKDFFLKPDDVKPEGVAAPTAINAEGNMPLLENAAEEKSAEVKFDKIDWSDKGKSRIARTNIFRRQMKFYLFFSTILVISNITMQVWARLHIHEGHKLGCANNGTEWLYITEFGELLITCHII